MKGAKGHPPVVWRSDLRPHGTDSEDRDEAETWVRQVRPPDWEPRPDGPSTVYRLFDAEDRLLYVGVTSRGYQRLHRHSTTQDWWVQVERAEFKHYPSRREAVQAESDAIRSEKPKFNVAVPAEVVPEPSRPARRPKDLADGLMVPRGRKELVGSSLEDDERMELLDRQTRRYFNMPAKEFLRVLRAGGIHRDDDRLRFVSNLISGLRA